MNGPVERRRAVDLRRVDVGLACERGADRLAIAAHRGIRDLRSRRSRGCHAEQKEADDKTCDSHHRVTLSKAGAAA